MPYFMISNLFWLVVFVWLQVELELSINTNSANYYAPRGEQIAHDVDGSTPSSASEQKDTFFTRCVNLRKLELAL